MDTDHCDEMVNFGTIASPTLDALTCLCQGDLSHLGPVLRSLIEELDLSSCHFYNDFKVPVPMEDKELLKSYMKLQSLAEPYAMYDVGGIINLLLVRKLLLTLTEKQLVNEQWAQESSTETQDTRLPIEKTEPELSPEQTAQEQIKPRSVQQGAKSNVKASPTKTRKPQAKKVPKLPKPKPVKDALWKYEEPDSENTEISPIDGDTHPEMDDYSLSSDAVDDDDNDSDYKPGAKSSSKANQVKDEDISDGDDGEAVCKPPAKKRGRPPGKLPKPYSCGKCKKTFSKQQTLEQHDCRMITCVCEVCGKVLVSKVGLRLHMQRHTGDRPHKCELCEKCFITAIELTRHMRRHRGEKSVTCEVCGRRFFNAGHIKAHMRTHTGERPYQCQICGHRFACSGNLHGHIRRIHVGERPHACEICPKKFHSGRDLKLHMRCHTGERPYLCDLCGKSFPTAGKVTRHKRSHYGEKPYVCPDCGRAFAKNDNLKHHREVTHPGSGLVPLPPVNMKPHQYRYYNRDRLPVTEEATDLAS